MWNKILQVTHYVRVDGDMYNTVHSVNNSNRFENILSSSNSSQTYILKRIKEIINKNRYG